MAKYEVSDVLRESIIADIENGVKWSQIAEEHGINYNIVQSVGQKHKRTKAGEEVQKGGKIVYWGDMRLTDGLPSPVTTYHISELEKAN